MIGDMDDPPKEDWITFLAEYDDGTQEPFQIDQVTLRSGDHVAPTIAREKQQEGLLKPGTICKVYRENPLGWILTDLGWLNIRRAPPGFKFEGS